MDQINSFIVGLFVLFICLGLVTVIPDLDFSQNAKDMFTYLLLAIGILAPFIGLRE